MEPTTFTDLKLNKQLVSAIEDLNYTTPSPIQLKAIPLIMAGHDVLGIAQTGTGKTAAYLLPILMKIKYAQGKTPRGLVLAPTRELAMQIDENIKSLAKYTDIRHVVLYGGVGPKTQIEQVEAGVDIVVATPGRFLELYSRGILITKQLKFMVLDEADKMMDMGFMHQIRDILEIIPRKRQNLLFSATFGEKVNYLSEEFLDFPVRVEVAPSATTSSMIAQKVYEVPNFKTKLNLLLYVLHDKDVFSRVIVFVRTKERADNIFKFLTRKFKEEELKVIHGNKGQNTRINSIDAFRDGKVRIMVATDVVARGIDVSMVTHVINFDIPFLYEDYVHRIGRTGRAENTGEAISFSSEAENYHVSKIEELIQLKIEKLPLPDDLWIEDTSYEEKQEMLLEIDNQRKKEDPEFKGAFHEKKVRPHHIAEEAFKKKHPNATKLPKRAEKVKEHKKGRSYDSKKNKSFIKGKK